MSMHRFSLVTNAMEALNFVFEPIDNGDPRWPPLKLGEI